MNTVIWRINLVQRINKINRAHFEACAYLHWSALLHWGLSRSVNRAWGKCESRAEDVDLWQSFGDLATTVFLPPPVAWKCKRAIVKAPLYIISLLFQVITNQKDGELICSGHRAMTFWVGMTTSKPSTPTWTAQGVVPAPVTQIDGASQSSTKKYLFLPASPQKHRPFHAG